MKAQRFWQWAGYSSAAKVGFSYGSMYRQRLFPNRQRLRGAPFSFFALFSFTLGERLWVWRLIAARGYSGRRKDIEKRASRFLAIKNQAPVSAISDGKGILHFEPS